MNAISLAATLLLLAPLTAALIAGIGNQKLPKAFSQGITIVGIAIAFIASLILAKSILLDQAAPIQLSLYPWSLLPGFQIAIDLNFNAFSLAMAVIVTFVSLAVHIYSVAYMADDEGKARFFCYMSLFTFAMLTLVCADNFLVLFFAWECVGLVSYLLIGFWFDKESANQASLKAFLVNRIADCAFLLGIAAIYAYCPGLSYSQVAANIPQLMQQSINLWPHFSCSALNLIAILLFIGAMGKSAQIPLHVWLPESMEGPTPISALIHAATMVTAGIFLLLRLDFIYLNTPVVLSIITIVGATQALSMGLLGIVQNDIKRIIAYSTLSQLGYMVAGIGCMAFAASFLHLITHACFKALLFLAAGAVIIQLHHLQDIRQMGGLRRLMPITYSCFLIGALALTAIPPTAGFYSKDTILAAVATAPVPGAHYAYVCLLASVFVTALYTFRAFFKVFHGEKTLNTTEATGVMYWPLIALALASLTIGAILFKPMILAPHWFTGSALNHVLNIEPQGVWSMAFDALYHLPFWLSIIGIVTAWLCYSLYPQLPGYLAKRFSTLYTILIHQYGFDAFNQKVFVSGTLGLAKYCAHTVDERLIDEGMVNGSGKAIQYLSRLLTRLQSGYLYHYAAIMIASLLALVVWQLFF